MRLIDADEFFDTFEELNIKPYNTFPTVDAEPVVRCRDCIYYKAYNDVWYRPKKDALVCINDEIEVNADDYCSWGKRKTK